MENIDEKDEKLENIQQDTKAEVVKEKDEFEQTLGVGDGQGRLVCCSSWGHKESDATELN